MVAVTDQAIDQIKQLIIDGEFSTGVAPAEGAGARAATGSVSQLTP